MIRASILYRLLLVAAMLMTPLLASAYYYVPQFDPDQNGVSDINDVTSVIDCLLRHGTTEGVNADVNLSGKVDIADVTLMIAFLLHPERFQDPRFYTIVYPECIIPENAEVFSVNGVSFAMVPIDTIDEQGNLVYDFSLGLTEVTVELWETVMGSKPHILFPTLRWPVVYITWFEACEFIDRLNNLTGREFRLPYSYEWEFAARGGLLYHQYNYAGSDDCDEVCWCADNLPENWAYYGCAVGIKEPNELGLYDLCGNVSEWCCDYLGYYDGMPYLDLINTVGGSWIFNGYECIISQSVKDAFIPESTYLDIGMRLAL